MGDAKKGVTIWRGELSVSLEELLLAGVAGITGSIGRLQPQSSHSQLVGEQQVVLGGAGAADFVAAVDSAAEDWQQADWQQLFCGVSAVAFAQVDWQHLQAVASEAGSVAPKAANSTRSCVKYLLTATKKRGPKGWIEVVGTCVTSM